MRKVDLKEILKPIFDILKKFRTHKKKTSMTIIIKTGEIHIDNIDINVNTKNFE